jgi:glycosyltransferase involved in cell wall biosynthesis
MKIVHIVDYFQPVLGYQEAFLAKEHAKLGHEVFVITSDRYAPVLYHKGAAFSILGPRRKGHGFFIEEGIKVWRLKTLFEFAGRPWLIGLENKVRELEPSIINVDGPNTITAFRIALLKLKDKKLRNVKLIFDDHMYPEVSVSKWKALYPILRRSSLRIVAKASDGVVAVSNTTRIFMHENYGFPLEKIKVIPLGVDPEVFRYDEMARNEIRRNLGINEGDVVFIYTGKIVPSKRVDILIEAAIQLVKSGYNLKVLLVGYSDENYQKQLQTKIEMEGCTQNFLWHEAVPNQNLYKYFSSADVAVWPCQHTNSILEAMACGLPVIVSDEARASEEVAYENGLTYKLGDVADLIEKMKTLLVDKTLRRKFGENGKKIVHEKFSWKMIAAEFIKIYEQN